MRQCRVRSLLVASSLCLAVTLAPPARAQVVRGTLSRTDDGTPLRDTPVVLRRVGGGVSARSVTDSAGRFELRAKARGIFQLQVLRIGGWVDAGARLGLLREDTLQLEVRLPRDVVRLPALQVVATSRLRALEAVGFYERKLTGQGTFVGPERIAARSPSRSTELLLGQPRLRVSYVAVGPGLSDRPVVSLRGGLGNLAGSCAPTVFLDGVEVGDGVDLLDTMPPQSIAALEIHSPLTAPAAYMGNWCGVILVWSRR